jgi:LysM repeat protein
VPPFSSTGGDLVDQFREWVDRQRERFSGRKNGVDTRAAARRATRRGSTRTQAVPIGTARTSPGGRPNRYGRQRVDRAARGTYTIILFAVLLVATIAVGFAVNWALGSSSSGASATPSPQVVSSPLPGPAPLSSPPPALFPSPSPSPGPPPGLQPPQQRFHVVEGGDTLNRISQRYGVTVEAIMQANGFTDRNRILRIGERLVIPDAPSGSPIPR